MFVKDTQGITKGSNLKLQIILAGIIILWLLVAIIVSATGILDQPPSRPRLITGLFFFFPIVGFVLAYKCSIHLRQAVHQLPIYWLVGLHGLRLISSSLLIVAVSYALPIQFSLPTGILESIAAIFSIPMAIAIYKGRRSVRFRRRYIIWNSLGLISLASGTILGVLYSDGIFGILANDLTTVSFTELPFSLITTFYVPLFILLHLLLLKRSPELKSPKETA